MRLGAQDERLILAKRDWALQVVIFAEMF